MRLLYSLFPETQSPGYFFLFFFRFAVGAAFFGVTIFADLAVFAGLAIVGFGGFAGPTDFAEIALGKDRQHQAVAIRRAGVRKNVDSADALSGARRAQDRY